MNISPVIVKEVVCTLYGVCYNEDLFDFCKHVFDEHWQDMAESRQKYVKGKFAEFQRDCLNFLSTLDDEKQTRFLTYVASKCKGAV